MQCVLCGGACIQWSNTNMSLLSLNDHIWFHTEELVSYRQKWSAQWHAHSLASNSFSEASLYRITFKHLALLLHMTFRDTQRRQLDWKENCCAMPGMPWPNWANKKIESRPITLHLFQIRLPNKIRYFGMPHISLFVAGLWHNIAILRLPLTNIEWVYS